MLLSATFAGGGSSDAQQIGNAGQGRRVAHADCAQCHGVDRNSYSSNLAAPTFDDIANVRRIAKVYLRGQEVDRAALRARWQAQSSKATPTH